MWQSRSPYSLDDILDRCVQTFFGRRWLKDGRVEIIYQKTPTVTVIYFVLKK